MTISSSRLESVIIGSGPKSAYRGYVYNLIGLKTYLIWEKSKRKEETKLRSKVLNSYEPPHFLRPTRRSSTKNYLHCSLQKQYDFSQILLGHSHTHAVGINAIALRAARGRSAMRRSLCFRPRLTFLVQLYHGDHAT
jgi:hypothetical protein